MNRKEKQANPDEFGTRFALKLIGIMIGILALLALGAAYSQMGSPLPGQ